MKATKTLGVLLGLAAIAMVAADASAYYHPGMGRFMQRDPGAGGANRIGAGGPAVDGGFIPRDPTGSNQYADGMNLYEYVGSNPNGGLDPSGLGRLLLDGTEIRHDGTIVEGSGEKAGPYSWSEHERLVRQREANIEIIRRNAERKSRENPGRPVTVRVPLRLGDEYFLITYEDGVQVRAILPGRRIVGTDWDCFWKCFDSTSSSVIFQVPGLGTGVGGTAAALTTPISKPAGVAKLGGATAKTTLGSKIFGKTFRNLMKRPAARVIGTRSATAIGRVGSKAVPIAGWVLLAWDGGAAYRCLIKCPKEICVLSDGTVREVKNN